MDLKLLDAEPTVDEREAIDAVVGVEATDGHRVARRDRGRRHLLLPTLRAAQRRVGWVTPGALAYTSRRLDVPPADAYGVATFYALLALEERPPEVLHVCTDLSCQLAGAEVPEGAHPSPCLGLCERAPASLRTIAGPEPREEQIPGESPPLPQTSGLKLLRRIAEGADPESPFEFRALARARELGPDAVIELVKASPLLGRGGAAFPTGVKWEAVARQPARPHYLVCNADESEPGTFKDRVLMEQDPFALVEAIAIAAFATACERAFVYVRAEYPLAHERLQHAIDVSSDLGVEIELRIGAGAYVCGEETALFQSIEGYRGEPRNKPPFPVEVGLYGKPTVVNNVETLLNVPHILLEDDPRDTRLFCVSGHVARPGLYELELGTPLSELLELAGAEPPKAVLLGGAAGSFVRPDQLDLPLSFEGAREVGSTLGSGVVIVYGERADLVAAVLRIAEFFRDESCGQCVPCRIGTVRQEEALHRLAAGSTNGDELAVLADLTQVMRDASICGLGQTAANAVASAMMSLGVLVP
jgi:NADH-quinone oxidoreductase subunit F